jgi:hypothetical protein
VHFYADDAMFVLRLLFRQKQKEAILKRLNQKVSNLKYDATIFVEFISYATLNVIYT